MKLYVGIVHSLAHLQKKKHNCKIHGTTEGKGKLPLCILFCSCTICFAVVPCILQLCFIFCRWTKTMYYYYVQFCWCANEIPVVLCILQLYIRVFLQRAGAGCARSLKGGVWPSLPANASDRKDSFSTATGARIDRAHQPTRAKKMVGQILHSRGKQLLPPFFTVLDVRIGCIERRY